MGALLHSFTALFRPDVHADRVVPPSGFTATLTLFAAGAMAFLAVFALALALAAGSLAKRWGDELAGGATVRIIAPKEQETAQIDAALRVLQSTPGVASARALSEAEQEALLAPWFGEGLDLSSLPVPRLIELRESGEGFDSNGLRLRLAAEAPGAVLDDHARWRDPLTRAASRLRLLGWLSIFLIWTTTAVIITLAANASLAANAQLVSVLRLVGATDSYIASAFVRRFTLRAGIGALGGVIIAMLCLMLLPTARASAGILTGLSLSGWQWVLPLCVPPLAAGVAFFATRTSASRTLGDLS